MLDCQPETNCSVSAKIMIVIEYYFGGWSQRMNGKSLVASSENQTANGENKYRPKYLKKPVYSTQKQTHNWYRRRRAH